MVTERIAERLVVRRFAVRTRPVVDVEGLFRRLSGEAVARSPLEVGSDLLVRLDALEKGLPRRGGRVRVVFDRCQLGDQVLAAVRPQLTRAEVNRPVPRVEEPQVAVE